MRYLILTGLVLALGLFPASGVYSQTVNDLILMTEQYPPYNFAEHGKLQGIFVDAMVLMLEKLDAELTREDIRLLPWANAYHKALNKPNTVLFSMARVGTRENLFKWVGPLCPSKTVLIARKERNIKIRSLDQAGKYRIGVLREDAGEHLLLEAGVPGNTLERVSKAVILIRMLNAGRIDVWCYNEITAEWFLGKNGFDPEDYEAVCIVNTLDAYYAFHKETPDALVRKFQTALEEIKAKPDDQGKSELEKILDKYLR